jgi:hypothetical protein
MFETGKDCPSHEYASPRGKVLFLNSQSKELDHYTPDVPVSQPPREQDTPDVVVPFTKPA